MTYGRPIGSGKYGEPSYSKTFRLTKACELWINEHGGRDYLESLVPKKYRQYVMEHKGEDKHEQKDPT